MQQRLLVAGPQLAHGREVTALGDPGPVDAHQRGGEAGGGVRQPLLAVLGGGELGLEVPVAGGAELDPLPLPVDDQPGRDRLHAAGRELRHDLLPQHRRDLVAVEPVEDAPGLVRVDLAVVEHGRVGDGAGDRLGGDLVEDHPAGRDLRLELLQQVPGDGLALAVLISGQVELVGVLEEPLELGDLRLLVAGDDVERPRSRCRRRRRAGPTARTGTSPGSPPPARACRGCGRCSTRPRSPCPGSRRSSGPWPGTRRSRAWSHDRSRRHRSRSRYRCPRCHHYSRPPLSCLRPCSLLARSFQPHIKSAMAVIPLRRGSSPRSDATPRRKYHTRRGHEMPVPAVIPATRLAPRTVPECCAGLPAGPIDPV